MAIRILLYFEKPYQNLIFNERTFSRSVVQMYMFKFCAKTVIN